MKKNTNSLKNPK